MSRFLGTLSKLILGIVLALVLVSLAGVVTARYLMGRLAVLPAKPLYGDEQAPVTTTTPNPSPPVITPAPAPEVTPPPNPVAPSADAPAVPADSYEAVVNQPIGLVLREGPGTDRPQLGGLDYNQTVVVLDEPTDQPWVKVRVTATGQEGWVKAGNLRRRTN
ncbi:MAG: SH3 domain-containing protein [Cyanobacteriota bacterium]|nr:SH3 domain-containing protein [Cyanobacteriota bacterium]